MKLTFIIAALVFTFADPAWPGQMKIWTDENGVTHIEYQKQRSAYDYEELKQEYKNELEKNRRLPQIEREKRERKRKGIMKEYDQKIIRLENKINREIADDRKQRERDREKRMLEIEIKQAKRDYEYKKSQEATYRKNYRDAHSSKYRKYWKEKLDGIYEAQKKYETLKHRSIQR